MDQITIVGGGLAGLTAAVSCAERRCRYGCWRPTMSSAAAPGP